MCVLCVYFLFLLPLSVAGLSCLVGVVVIGSVVVDVISFGPFWMWCCWFVLVVSFFLWFLGKSRIFRTQRWNGGCLMCVG